MIADEYWLDLPGLFPNVPAFVPTGVIPLAAGLVGLILFYALMRLALSYQGRKANHSEALLGIFTFLVVGLVILTVIGVFFRGENMALVLPF